MKKVVSILITLVLSSVSLFASYNSLGVPDSSEIREQLAERWFEAPLSAVRQNMPEVYYNEAGQKFQVRLEETNDTFNIFVSPSSEINVTVYTSKGVSVEKQEVFPGDSAGSFVLVRDKKTEKPIRVRYYFMKNNEVFVQITPGQKTALADMVIYNNYAARGVPTGVPFAKFYEISFEDLMNVTKTKLPWKYVTADCTVYHSVQQMIAVIKEKLPKIMIANDAMYDENNQLVHISSGNKYSTDGLDETKLYLSSAGFLKWIVDGIVEPATGLGTSISDLTEPTVEFDSVGKIGVMSQEWNLYFTLDWCRNLAAKAYSVRSRRNVDFKSAGLDVNKNYFASEVSGGKISTSSGYIKNTGYSIEKIKSVLYVLAVTEPSWFYLAAIRQGSCLKPDELVFNNCAVFFPYFDNNGKFGCFVFEQGKEISLEKFVKKYKDAYIHLERVKSLEAFFPYEKK